MATTFGQYFRDRRKALGATLRKFCVETGLDPGNVSRLERGLARAPKSDVTLTAYALALHLVPGSDEWGRFMDLAHVDAGRIPKELLDDEEILRKLPVLFRTLRGERVSDEKLEELIRIIRGDARCDGNTEPRS